MGLRAIYLSYTTRSSIHNRTESRTEMHLLDGAGGGPVGAEIMNTVGARGAEG